MLPTATPPGTYSQARPIGSATCSRCGEPFQRFAREVICGECRMPRSYAGAMPGAPLSFRQRQLVNLIAAGMTNKEMGEALKISEGTVKVYISAVFVKTGVSSRHELACLVLNDRLTLIASHLSVVRAALEQPQQEDPGRAPRSADEALKLIEELRQQWNPPSACALT